MVFTKRVQGWDLVLPVQVLTSCPETLHVRSKDYESIIAAPLGNKISSFLCEWDSQPAQIWDERFLIRFLFSHHHGQVLKWLQQLDCFNKSQSHALGAASRLPGC